jgi:hypothetical protein
MGKKINADFSGETWERNHMEDLSLNGKIMLNCTVNRMGGCGLD